jgi:hypothetical protein
MSDDPYADRRRLTFEQVEGVEPLPTQLQTKQLSQQLRALFWRVVHRNLEGSAEHEEYRERRYFSKDWETIFYDNHTLREHRMADEFVNDADTLIMRVKQTFERGSYVEVFGFLQYVLRHRDCPYGFPEAVDSMLVRGGAAYRVLDSTTIVPIGSDAEKATLERAFADLASKEFRGARSHLQAAGSDLTEGNYASSIRESVHAVESVARTLATSGSLGDALSRLEQATTIHPALKRGFSNIYGYTSDEQGIRHPLLDGDQAKVDEADALFMIGACAAFVSYLIHKARLAGVLSG